MAIIRIARLWPGGGRAATAALPAVTPVDIDSPGDSLEAFASEAVVVPLVPATATGPVAVPLPMPKPRSAAPSRDWTLAMTAARWLGVIALGAGAAAAGWSYRMRIAAPPTGTLSVQTTPAALPVVIDGRAAGVTPVTLTLAPAAYNIQIGTGAQRRDLTVSIVAGSAVLQHLELPAAAAEAPTTGALLVQTEPSGQAVTVDGEERGTSPLEIDALAAGEHTVVVRGSRGTLRRSVTVKAGETVSLLVAPVAAAAAPAPGWLSVQAPTRLELRQGGKLLGTTETEQIMLPAGKHDIELVNEAAGYRARRQIEILPGQTTSVPVELPFGSLNINAQPWAEVWINGERVGETPIANLSRRIGTYEVVFRHPDLGERRESVNVTLRQPVRLGVDMRSK